MLFSSGRVLSRTNLSIYGRYWDEIPTIPIGQMPSSECCGKFNVEHYQAKKTNTLVQKCCTWASSTRVSANTSLNPRRGYTFTTNCHRINVDELGVIAKHIKLCPKLQHLACNLMHPHPCADIWPPLSRL